MPRALKWSAPILAMTAALGFGLGTGDGPLAFQPQPAYAACQAAHTLCSFGDYTRTSLMTAQYFESGVGAVTPSAGTTWDITANWSTAFPGCTDLSETASATVTWDGSSSSWVLSSTTLTNNIVGIAICNTVGCGSAAATYTLYVDINDPAPGGYNLRYVDYASSGSLPNGTLCSGGSRSPVSSSVSGTDTGGWGSRCAYNCSYSNGPVIPIYYQ